MKNATNSFRLFAVAASEWLLVLPATLLLAGSALRQLQPPQYDPARTIGMIFEWYRTSYRLRYAPAGLARE